MAQEKLEIIEPRSEQSLALASASTLPALMPSLLDREIRSQDADAFGHHHFALALQSLIEAERHSPPYSIGLLGKWGTGKSSIKTLYLEALREDQRRNTSNQGRTRAQRIHSITFNAWRFGGENIRRALLRHVYIELGGDEEKIMDSLFHQLQKPTQTPKSWQEIAREVYDKWIWNLLQVLLVIAGLLGLTWLASRLFHLTEEWVIASIFAIQSLFAIKSFKDLSDAKRFAISRYSTVNRVELPTISAEQFEKLLVDQIALYCKQHPDCERLVVFVDDLDRLSAEEMVSGLDAIRTFMDIPQEQGDKATIGMVFVISCDEDRVADALVNRRKQNGSEIPGVILSRTDARRYLDRIFQFRLEIPPFPRQDMRSFALDCFHHKLLEIEQSVIKRGANIEEVVSRMIHVGVQSPRNALQIVNAFTESWWLAEQRERAGNGTDRHGALTEGAVTRYPLALAVLSALRVDFPDFYTDLQQEPDLIARFMDVFVHKKPMEEQPEGIRIILEKYALPSASESNAEKPLGLKTHYRPLRQYLTSVATIPYPQSLQPLLLLSQDPVSRTIGDAGRRIYDALVSGDVDGALADLGRDKDDRLLHADQVRWLSNLMEQIEDDTSDRKDNAGAVIAGLANRLPRSEAELLLVPLARRLANSFPLRWRVGVDRIESILPLLPESDKKNVLGRLIGDLLRTQGNIDFLLPTGETPSLDEAIAMSRKTVDLALSIRESVGIHPMDDIQLQNWLLVRHVAVAGKTQQLPFADLEQWMNSHEVHLLPALGIRYLDVLADMLEEKGTYEKMELAPASQRIATELDRHWLAGEESRDKVWILVNRFVGIDAGKPNIPAQKFFQAYHEKATTPVLSQFISNAASRVTKFVGDKNMDEADSDALRILIATLSSQPEVAADALTKVGDLSIKLSQYVPFAQPATELTEAIGKVSSEENGRVLGDWVPRLFTDLPDLCLDYVASHFSTGLDNTQRQSLVDSLNTNSQFNPPVDDTARRYVCLINNIPHQAFITEPLRSHCITVLDWIHRQFSSEPVLKAVFPAMPKMIQSGPSQEVAVMLHQLMSQSRTYPTIYGFLHEVMTGRWPSSLVVPAPYNPESIFNWAQEVVTNQPSSASAKQIILSMQSMVSTGVLGEDKEAILVDSASLIWQFHPLEASKILCHASSLLSPEKVAGLSISLDLNDQTNLETLRSTWKYFAKYFTSEQRMAVANTLLRDFQ